jgi:ribosomal protein S18 acetylase RimI-like enzyme
VVYRLYKSEDFAQLYAIEEACFQPPFRFGRRYLLRLVSDANATTWVALEGEEPCGFAIAEWTRENNGLVGYIQTIEVEPGWRGRGVGRELLHRMEKSARDAGAQAIWLHVDEENSAAIRLYEANGFVRAGREENYYPNGRPALVFGKPLREKRQA